MAVDGNQKRGGVDSQSRFSLSSIPVNRPVQAHSVTGLAWPRVNKVPTLGGRPAGLVEMATLVLVRT